MNWTIFVDALATNSSSPVTTDSVGAATVWSRSSRVGAVWLVREDLNDPDLLFLELFL